MTKLEALKAAKADLISKIEVIDELIDLFSSSAVTIQQYEDLVSKLGKEVYRELCDRPVTVEPVKEPLK